MKVNNWKSKIIKFLEENRALVILVFCLPASYIFDVILNIQRFIFLSVFSSPKRHDERVRNIQKKVQEWHKLPTKDKNLLCTARANWLSLSTKFFQKNKCHQVSIDLFDILELDEQKLTIRVEPLVTVDQVTRFLIPKGYTLAVTLEIGDATLGGLALGTGMTTHSHQVGLYHENVISYDVILPDGSLIRATEDENIELYKTLPWSHGSMGFLVALTLKLVKIKPYVKITYIPVVGQENYCNLIRKVSGAESKKDPIPEYVEGTIFSKDKAVIMKADYSNFDPRFKVNKVARWYKPWFYKYVESFLSTGEHTELIPLRDYLLRHNRAIFWVVESMIPFGNNPIFRFFLGWLLPPKPAFLKFTTTQGVRAYTFTRQVFQDIILPIQELEKQIDNSCKIFDIFPLLVYPCRIYDRGPSSGQLRRPPQKYIVKQTDYAIYNDLGIYGVPGYVKRKERYNPVAAMREMEKFSRDVGGFSFLYADIFMTKEEFEGMFDLKLYEHVRRKYGLENAFPHLYDKVKPEIDVFEVGRQFEIK